ncbi:uncharacterized protein A1O9_00268 [Exophiala aquamarina CBS 119918]|uniref:ATPase inhibitor, mitochondrial n=1 Tax=Exophiala aquamarina CBS 119918 TaxID=1182545 RepID=A0A072PR27_9EURO|nr:uncharacterized protein A1O9_00268 [Exophiala aquamarina CBS 119918]KEF62296.1 hypothetical protein A1O9_00268 [Exophiala aquamarina CBS 119918]
MLRTQAIKLARAAPAVRRSFSSVAMRAAEGDTGATRPGGVASSDAFTRREQASEAKYIRDKELESIKKLKEKLEAQREHLNKLDQHIKEMENERSGGEHH